MFDLDKTLARSKENVNKSMAFLLAELSTRTKVAIISGGRREQLEEQVVDQLPPSANITNIYLLPTSGGQLLTYEEREWVKVYAEELTIEEADRVEEAIEQGVCDTGLVDLSTPSHGPRMENRGSEIAFSALGQHAPITEKEAWDKKDTKRKALRDAIAKLLPEYDVKIGGSTTIDVTKHGINKAYGVRKLAEYLSIEIANMLYVGDALYPGGNDEIVKETGIKTQEVCDPDETENVIRSLLGKKAPAQIQDNEKNSGKKEISAPLYPGRKSAETYTPFEESLRKDIQGDVTKKPDELESFSKDTSIFKRIPSLVVYPKNAEDVSTLVKAVAEERKKNPSALISVTGRSAGTDMSGGPLTTSIVAVFMRYMNKVIEITTTAEGG
jgi:phosphomannomutase